MNKKQLILKSLLVIGLVLLMLIPVFSQTNISSPYSRYGLGQLHETSNFKLTSMGGMGLAVKKNDLINVSNPATYAGFDSTSFVFECGVRGIFSQLSDNNNNKALSNNLSLNYLLFGFPIGKRISTSFGLLPYSNMGYKLSDSTVLDNIGNVNYLYQGTGGFNKAFIGSAISILPNLSIGANFSYIFGSLQKTRTITFPEVANIYSLRHNESLIANDFLLDYGLFYEKKLKNNYAIAIGLTSSNATKINASTDVLIESFSGVNYIQPNIKDTIVNTSTIGKIAIPASYGGGIALKKGDNWLLGLDYKFQEWSKFTSFGLSDSLKNSTQIAIGTEFSPSYTISSSILKRSTYRFGFKYHKTYLQIRNTQLRDYGISFGVGIPVQRSRSNLNIGLEFGQRGTTDNNLIKETYGMLTFSLSIYERWFIRRKYN